MPTTLKNYRQKKRQVGTISSFSGDTLPQGWLLLHGQILQIADYPDLFGVIGIEYGGDGVTTFQLPDYRGRIAVGKDNMGGVAANRMTSGGSGVDGNTLGATGGSQTHTLSKAQMPLHGHPWKRHVADTLGDTNGIGGIMYGSQFGITQRAEYTGSPSNSIAQQIGGSGSGAAHQNTQPCIVCNYIIRAF